MAVASGLVGRSLLERGRQNAIAQAGTLPEPTATAPPLPDGAELAVDGITPLVVPERAVLSDRHRAPRPRPDINTWRLRVTGMVERPIVLTYDELVAMPLVEQYVTIACVSNEVGGDLVGNALWRGVRLKELLQQAGVDPAATQIVGRAVDGFTVGFPTGYAIADDREPLVAVGMNGEPLPVDHGFPARLIVPGPVRLRQRDEVADRDRADDLGGVRRLLGAARLGEGGTDPHPVEDRRAAARGEPRRRER